MQFPADLIAKPTSAFSVGVMGRVCASKSGALPPTPREPSAKVNEKEYAELLQAKAASNFLEVAADPPSATWLQDTVAAHTGHHAREHIGETFPPRMVRPPQLQS